MTTDYSKPDFKDRTINTENKFSKIRAIQVYNVDKLKVSKKMEQKGKRE